MNTITSFSVGADRQGRIVREGFLDGGEITIGAGGVTTYAYDADGNLADLGYPSGAHVQYTSDLAGRPVTVTREGTTAVVSSVDYLPFGPLTKIEFGNGTTRESTYDSRYRMTSNKLRAASSTLAEYNYTSDDAGNITAIADAVVASVHNTKDRDRRQLSLWLRHVPVSPSMVDDIPFHKGFVLAGGSKAHGDE